MEAGSMIKEVVYLCQVSFLLFASSTAPESYKGVNCSRVVFLFLFFCLSSSSAEFFASPVELPHQTRLNFSEDSSATCLFVIFIFISVYVWADLSASLSFLFVCLLSIDVPVFSENTDGSLESRFLCVLVLLWFPISRQQRRSILFILCWFSEQ